MTTITNDFIPAWNVIHAVEKLCSNAFMCELIEINARGQFVAKVYAAYKDPRALVSKFMKAGGRVVEISGGQGNWYEYTFRIENE